MAISSYFSTLQRANGFPEKTRIANGLPSYSSAVQEKMSRHGRSMSWVVPVTVPIPGVRTRRLRLYLPNLSRVHHLGISRFVRRRGPMLLCFLLIASVFVVLSFARRFGPEEKQWTPNFDLQRIWKWEIASGHYPSKRERLTEPPLNPALPPRKAPSSTLTLQTSTGASVHYDACQPPSIAYPPRPVPGSVADLDSVMDHCDFSQNKKFCRVGAALDNGNRVRRGKMDEWKYIYMEQDRENFTEPAQMSWSTGIQDPNAGLIKKRGVEWESPLELRPTLQHTPYSSLPSPCDPENPRIFHLFWTGPFTDKPYLALLSFLFTQNVGLHLKDDLEVNVCRPEFWLWINPGPAASVPNPNALGDMFEQLKTNPWAAPFLHPRFKDVIKFKLWNTTEQLDGVPEIKNEWRELRETLFNSGGHIINVPVEKQQASRALAEEASNTTAADVKPSATGGDKSDEDDMLNRLGSKSSSSYDRLSVILSDMARFVLCHRFGGIYLDADTILLRDWEELWGWKVLRMNKNSALGSFLFRTALKNGLDFHPMTVSRYTKDAHLEGLLLRLPDALFDSAWLNTGSIPARETAATLLHRVLPRTFTMSPANLFVSAQSSAQPQALGFEASSAGRIPITSITSELGPRFSAGEKAARAAAMPDIDPEEWVDKAADDKRDLDWATVLKRTFEAYIRNERPNMYGEWLQW
ncbi:hypothetical protein EDD17DRAFT_1508393 [Pisolithus thermaeus]|nr:hypothetical protein EDD17DRAFT_1508393 [Pisolithus thermaeus]